MKNFFIIINFIIIVILTQSLTGKKVKLRNLTVNDLIRKTMSTYKNLNIYKTESVNQFLNSIKEDKDYAIKLFLYQEERDKYFIYDKLIELSEINKIAVKKIIYLSLPADGAYSEVISPYVFHLIDKNPKNCIKIYYNFYKDKKTKKFFYKNKFKIHKANYILFDYYTFGYKYKNNNYSDMYDELIESKLYSFLIKNKEKKIYKNIFEDFNVFLKKRKEELKEMSSRILKTSK